jgi:hypothetical protein
MQIFSIASPEEVGTAYETACAIIRVCAHNWRGPRIEAARQLAYRRRNRIL